MSAEILHVTDDNFDTEVLSSDLPVLVDFLAEWCGPCKMLAPVLDEVSGEYEGKLKFAKISTEDFPDIAGQNHITGIPCLIIFNKGEEVDRIVGFAPKDQLKAKIDTVLSSI